MKRFCVMTTTILAFFPLLGEEATPSPVVEKTAEVPILVKEETPAPETPAPPVVETVAEAPVLPPPPPVPSRVVREEPNWLSWESWLAFLYWQPMQENMESSGIKTGLIESGFSGVNSGPFVNLPFDFKPAFSIGFGSQLAQKSLHLFAEYTRFYATQEARGTHHQYYPKQLDPGTLLVFLNGISSAGGGIGTAAPFSFSQVWRLKMNLLDTLFGYYMHEKSLFQFHHFVGTRAAFIDQNHVVYYAANLVNGGEEVGTAKANLKTSSWGIGIRGGSDMQCRMGEHLRFYALGAGDILYTHYDWHGISNAIVPSVAVNWQNNVTQKDINTARIHLEAELGFMWGKSFTWRCSPANPYHLDLTAGYGFQVFFDQNMFRHFTTAFEEISTDTHTGLSMLIGAISTPISNLPNGNLYIQGLRITAALQF